MGDTWLFNETLLFLTAVEGGGGGVTWLFNEVMLFKHIPG